MNPTEELLEGWTVALDDAVAEVFESMLQRSCAPTQRASSARADIGASASATAVMTAVSLKDFPANSGRGDMALVGVVYRLAAAEIGDMP